MTGFASAEETKNGKKVSCLIRALNHRYLDLSLRFSEDLYFLEPLARALVRQYFARGKIELRLSIEEETPQFLLQENALDALLDALSSIRTKAIDCPFPDALAVLSYPRIIQKIEWPEEEKKNLALMALEKTLKETQNARMREGQALRDSLLSQITEIFNIVSETKALLKEALPDYMAKLSKKIKVLAPEIEDARISQEIAVYIQKIDVDEELVRLQIHLKEIERLLKEGGVIGKKIDFIVQELHREANTLGAKAANAEISQNAVMLKQLIEQMREQVQNIE